MLATFIALMALVLAFSILGIIVFSFIFWFWMFVDVLQRKNFERLPWILVLIFLSLLGAVMYYLMIKVKDQKPKRVVRRRPPARKSRKRRKR